MSHDTGHGHSKEVKSIISFKHSFWLVIIIVGLFIAALNFIQAEKGGEEGKVETKSKTELNGGAVQEENRTQAKPEEHPRPEAPAADTAKTAQ